jgi:hypothetical protein
MTQCIRNARRAEKVEEVGNFKEVPILSRESVCDQSRKNPEASAMRSACGQIEKTREGMNIFGCSLHWTRNLEGDQAQGGTAGGKWLNTNLSGRNLLGEQGPEGEARLRDARKNVMRAVALERVYRTTARNKASKG